MLLFFGHLPGGWKNSPCSKQSTIRTLGTYASENYWCITGSNFTSKLIHSQMQACATFHFWLLKSRMIFHPPGNRPKNITTAGGESKPKVFVCTCTFLFHVSSTDGHILLKIVHCLGPINCASYACYGWRTSATRAHNTVFTTSKNLLQLQLQLFAPSRLSGGKDLQVHLFVSGTNKFCILIGIKAPVSPYLTGIDWNDSLTTK